MPPKGGPRGLDQLHASKPYFRYNTQMAAHMPQQRAARPLGGVVRPPQGSGGLHILTPHFGAPAMPHPFNAMSGALRGLKGGYR